MPCGATGDGDYSILHTKYVSNDRSTRTAEMCFTFSNLNWYMDSPVRSWPR